MNYYEILKVNKNATKEEITLAHKRLAMKLHPDKNPNNKKAEDDFKKVNQAYSTLNNPELKAKYDIEQNAKATQANYENTRNDFNSNKNSTPNNQKKQSHDSFSQKKNSDANTFQPGSNSQFQFNKNHQNNHNTPQILVPINFWDAVAGNTVTVNYHHAGISYISELELPKGVNSGFLFNISAQNTNLILEIVVLKDSYFHREGLNLFSTIDIPFHISTLGGDMIFEHYLGDLKINIPANSKNGDNITLFNQGIIDSNFNAGDLTLKINITCPTNLTDEQVELLKKFAIIESKKEKGLYFFKTAPFFEAIRKKFIKA